MMTEEEKNTPITLGMLDSIFKEIEVLMMPKINAFSDAVDRSCNSYEKSILELADTCSKTIEELNILRSFVIAVYANQNFLSFERATQVYGDYATKFSNIFKEAKED